MASHIRYFVMYGGHAFSGGDALERLKQYSMLPEVKTPQQAIAAEKKINEMVGKKVCDLFIFRERRGLNRKQSRYQRLIQFYGTSRPKFLRKPPLRIPKHGRANQTVGQTFATPGAGLSFSQQIQYNQVYQFGGGQPSAAPDNDN